MRHTIFLLCFVLCFTCVRADVFEDLAFQIRTNANGQSVILSENVRWGPSELGGRGMISKRKILANETIFLLPKNGSHVLNTDEVCSQIRYLKDTPGLCETLRMVTEQNQTYRISPHILLAYTILILQQTAEDPVHKLYLETLPTSLPTQGMYLNESETMFVLNGTFSRPYLIDAIRHYDRIFRFATGKVRDQVFELLQQYHPDVFDKERDFSDDKIRHALSLVQSRSWGPTNETIVMVAGADLFNNHFNSYGVYGFSNSSFEHLGLRARHDIEPEEEVYLSYFDIRQRTIYDSVITYGYVEPSLSIPLRFSYVFNESRDTFVDFRKKLLEESKCLDPILFSKGAINGTGRFVECARIVCARPADFEKIKTPVQPMTLENEACAIRLVYRSFEHAKSSFDTTIAEDEEVLSTIDMTPTQRIMYEVRVHEKTTIYAALSNLERYWLSLIRK